MQRTYYLAGVLLFLPPALVAQDDDPHAELDTLTITARPPGSQSLEHTAQPVSILTGENLERHRAGTLGETLNSEPGVTGSHFGAGASRPIIRGLDGPRVRVLQDGVGTLDVSTISADHQAAVEPFQAEQIEIMRGPATLLYGSGASGGLVNVVTGRIPEYLPDFNADLLGQYETVNNGRTTGLRARGSVEQFAFHFDGLKRDAGNYEAADGEIENSFVETENANFGTSWIGNRGFFGFSYGRYETTYGIPPEEDHDDAGGHGHEEVFIDLVQDRFDAAGQIEKPFNGMRSINFRVGYNDYMHTEFEGPGEAGTIFENRAWESRLEFNHAPVGPFIGTAGIQFQDRDFDAIGEEAFVPPAQQQSVGLFLFEDTDWRNWHFELGGRYEHQMIEPDVPGYTGDIEHNVYSLSAGALWDFTPGYSVGLNVTRAQRAPALEELLANGPHLATGTFELGTSTLDAETSSNLDLGLRKTDGRLTWRTNVFLNYIEDFIYLASQDNNGDGNADTVDEEGNPGGELLLVNYTQADALFYGVEAEAMLNLFDNNSGSLDARLFGDWVRARLSGGEDLPRISPARLGLGLDWHRGSWQADIEGIHVFEQQDTAPLETATDSYLMLNAGLGYALTAGMELSLRGSNLLDEDARRHTSFIKDRAPLAGRSVMAGIQLSF